MVPLDKHGREGQQCEKARRNAQGCEGEEIVEICVGEVRDQATKNNDNHSEQARHSLRQKTVERHMGERQEEPTIPNATKRKSLNALLNSTIFETN